MDELPITAEERRAAADAANAVAVIDAEKQAYTRRCGFRIYDWACSVDLSAELTKQRSFTLDIDPMLIDPSAVEAWQKALGEKGFILEIGQGAVTARLPD